MSKCVSWLKAARPASQSYIVFPLLFGQLLVVRSGRPMDWIAFILVQLFGLFDQLYIVFANDWADVEADRRNSTFNIFSGGSRVIVDGEITRRSIGVAALLAVSLAVLTGIGMWVTSNSYLPFVLVLFAIALLHAYSFYPVRMNYRGGGEMLQMLGVGGVLVCIGYAAQTGSMEGFPWSVLAVTLPISLSCAITTALPDEPSDRKSNKKTAGVLIDPKRAALLAILLGAGSLVVWLVANPLSMELTPRIVTAAVPSAALLASLLHFGGAAGSKKLNHFVAGIVATNIFLFIALCIAVVLA